MYLLKRDCHRRLLCVDCHPGYRIFLRLIYIYFCDIIFLVFKYKNSKNKNAPARTGAHVRARAPENFKTCARARPRTRKNFKGAHAHARALEILR